jgi:hypothetical protein
MRLLLTLGLGALAMSVASAAVAAETPEQFPDFPHREETFYFCSACHAFGLSGRQGMDRARWDETLTWMTSRHGMLELTGDDRERILAYLVQAFPPRQQGGWRNPFSP